MGLVTTFSSAMLQPAIWPEQARTLAAKIAASQTIAHGTVLAELSASPGAFTAYDGTKVANPGAGPTLAESVGAGALGAGTYGVAFSYVNANGESLISPVASVTIGANKKIDVTAITPLPAGVASVNWYLTAAGGTILQKIANNNGAAFSINALPSAGAVLPPLTSTIIKATDGSGVAKAIAQYDIATDSDGKIFFGTSASSEFGESHLTAPVFYSGYFNCADLTGLDAAAVASLGALVQGDISTGILRLG